jgi:hypothetical protein
LGSSQKEIEEMRFQKLDHNGKNSFALIFDKGDEFIGELTAFAKKKRPLRESFYGDRRLPGCHPGVF